MEKKDISLELYRVFYKVSKYLSFSKAASALYISQSAVSQSIRTLEQKLDNVLFQRSTKKVTLTHEGEELLKYIEPALNLIERGESFMIEGHEMNRGKLHIGASDTICRYYLIDYLEKFHQIYPNVTIQITNRTSIDCVHLLEQGLVDFIISNLPNDYITGEMDITPVMKFKDVFVGNDTYSQLYQSSISMSTLLEYPILTLEPNTTTYEYIDKRFKQFGYQLEPAVALGSIDLLIDMAKIGIGLSYVPDYCIRHDKDLKIINLKENISNRHLGIVVRKDRPLSESGRTFLEMLK